MATKTPTNVVVASFHVNNLISHLPRQIFVDSTKNILRKAIVFAYDQVVSPP